MMELLLPALLGGIGVALVAGPLGSFLVWRRMAYFGDTLSHSALLGVALGYALELNINMTVIVVCISMALGLVALQQQRYIANDTVLGILAHSSLALGLVVVSLLNDSRLNLAGFLFGDLLSVTTEDLIAIYAGSAIVLTALVLLWRPLLAITLHEELAQVEGVRVFWVRLALMLIIALVIATALKIVGILLITALMLIPAASARRWASSPEIMAVLASLLGILAVCGGLVMAYRFDTSLGPTIVVCSTLIFLVCYLWPKKNG
jgi:zinc transport system permease protein